MSDALVIILLVAAPSGAASADAVRGAFAAQGDAAPQVRVSEAQAAPTEDEQRAVLAAPGNAAVVVVRWAQGGADHATVEVRARSGVRARDLKFGAHDPWAERYRTLALAVSQMLPDPEVSPSVPEPPVAPPVIAPPVVAPPVVGAPESKGPSPRPAPTTRSPGPFADLALSLTPGLSAPSLTYGAAAGAGYQREHLGLRGEVAAEWGTTDHAGTTRLSTLSMAGGPGLRAQVAPWLVATGRAQLRVERLLASRLEVDASRILGRAELGGELAWRASDATQLTLGAVVSSAFGETPLLAGRQNVGVIPLVRTSFALGARFLF